MNLIPKAALKTPALQTLRAGPAHLGLAPAFGLRAALAPLLFDRILQFRLRGSRREVFQGILPMNRPTSNPSKEGSRPVNARAQFPSWEGLGVGSGEQIANARLWSLSMNLKVARVTPCAPLGYPRNGAHGACALRFADSGASPTLTRNPRSCWMFPMAAHASF